MNVDVTIVSTGEVHYVNRPRITAVPVTVFRGGEPVGRRVVRVSDIDITRAQIISHPRVQPLPQAAGWARPASPGRPAVQPPVVAPRPRPEIHVTPWKNPDRSAQVSQPRVLQRPTDVPEPRPGVPSRHVPPPVIARNPPAPAALPFPTRQKAMQQTDPGRPLEPVQRQNLRQGRPAGPHRDPEEPNHAAKPAPRPRKPERDKPQ